MDSIDSQISKQTSRAGYALDLIRIFLGLALFVRSIVFVMNQAMLMTMLQSASSGFLTSVVTPYIILAHMAGGLMLMFGLLARVAAIIQIPVLVGAVFFVNLRGGFMSTDQGLELSALVLFLLIVFAAVGSGRLSVDHYLKNRQSTIMDDLIQRD